MDYKWTEWRYFILRMQHFLYSSIQIQEKIEIHIKCTFIQRSNRSIESHNPNLELHKMTSRQIRDPNIHSYNDDPENVIHANHT